MTVMLDDRVGLHAEQVFDMPMIVDATIAQRIASGNTRSVSIAGMRHSQGGHTVVRDGRVALTAAALNRIGQPVLYAGPASDPVAGTVEVEAGATWGELHRVLGPMRLAPMVQQSSSDFTIGGSLSVNCHGRDPRFGPLSTCIQDITVLTGTLGVLTVSAQTHPDLFLAALGGYGACGMILKATLRVTRNERLVYVGDSKVRTISEYGAHAQDLLRFSGQDTHLHYAWVCCVPDSRFYAQVLITDFVAEAPGQPGELQDRFKEEQWGEDEMLRAGWSAARRMPELVRPIVWQELLDRHRTTAKPGEFGKGAAATRINWLRSATSFTAYRGENDTEILQEYFVPVAQLEDMMHFLKKLFARSPAFNVLSTTLRVVREDTQTLLSYCPGERVCIAVDMAVPTHGSGASRDLSPRVLEGLSQANAQARVLGGSFYLPYHKVATREEFLAAYDGSGGVGKLRQAADTCNPKVGGKRRFWNNFLERYLP